MNRNLRRILLVILPLALVILLAMIFLRDLVEEHVVIPLYYFFWLMGLTLRSIPQSAYWTALVVAGMLLAARALIRKPVYRDIPEPSTPRERSSRYQFWLRTFFLLRSSAFSLEYSSYELRRLLLNILSSQENLSFNEVEARLQDGSIPAPEAVRQLVLKRQVGGSLPPPGWLRRALYLLKERFFPHTLSVKESPLDAELDVILNYLESLLEVNP